MNVNITELKAKLSAYLDKVRRGQRVTVLDRRTAIAEIVPLTVEGRSLDVTNAALPPSAIDEVQGVQPKRTVDIAAILAETRGER